MLRSGLARGGGHGGDVKKRLVQAILSSSSSSCPSAPTLISAFETLQSYRRVLPLLFPASSFRSVHDTHSILHLRVFSSSSRVFSSFSVGQEVEYKGPDQPLQQEKVPIATPYSEDDSCSHVLKVQLEKQSRLIPVKSYFLCTGIDLRGLQSEYAFNVAPSSSRVTNCVVLRFYDPTFRDELPSSEEGLGNGSKCCHMVVFQYGSVVLFNIPDHEVDTYLKLVQRHASGMLPEVRKDDYAVVEKPTMEAWMQGGLDYLMVKNLNIDGIRTIGSVLGQSVALDYYVRQVDGVVAEFTDIYRVMEKTGAFNMELKKLFQLVAKANTNVADVILKLGLFERYDIAWKDANYAEIWEYLRDEYELTQRLASLDFKLKFIEHNSGFLQVILENRKSQFLEWLIIILIGADMLISIYK